MLRIGGFLEQSLIDWEGKIVSVIFTKGCNFRCGYCHNPSLVIPELMNETADIKVDTILSYFSKRKEWLDGVVISGGEPTIHKNLPEFLYMIRQIGLPIKLDTNGTNPAMIKDLLLNNLIEYVALDIKTVLKPDPYSIITNYPCESAVLLIKETIAHLQSSGKKYELRTTFLSGFHTDTIIETLENEFRSMKFTINTFRKGDIVEKYLPGKSHG